MKGFDLDLAQASPQRSTEHRRRGQGGDTVLVSRLRGGEGLAESREATWLGQVQASGKVVAERAGDVEEGQWNRRSS